MIEYIKGDILTNIDLRQPTVILHGCNCFHVMGAGIAKYLKKQYPVVYQADVQQSARGDKYKLGSYSLARIDKFFHILNCYTQYDTAKVHGQVMVDYTAVDNIMKKVAEKYDGWEIRMPKIGCGLAGGDWGRVREIIEERLEHQIVKVYEL